jgi:hypothetical protein
MEAKELRIGNWVTYDGWHPDAALKGQEMNPYPTKVKSIEIDESKNDYIIEGNYIERGYSASFTPIPLTEELLLKCGFEWDGSWLQLELPYARWHIAFWGGVIDKMSIRQYKPPYDNPNVVEIGFASNYTEYLHQLQNLYFALTGQELNIEL